MKINDWLKLAVAALTESGIDTARLDSLVLLEDCTAHDRAWLLAHPETELNTDQLHNLADGLERRLQHEPLAYIRGHSEFYGREFAVNEHVLVPRPETEAMIDLLRKLAPSGARVADIGTGSGAIAVTAALEINSEVVATDIDETCLAVAEHNALTYEVRLRQFQGNLLEPFLQKDCDFRPEVVLANLPYVPTDFTINEAAKHEPALALFGGTDGLDLYRTMFAQTTDLTLKPKLILCESLPAQHIDLAAIAAEHDYQLIETADFIQAFQLKD